jgi:aminopeptidase N
VFVPEFISGAMENVACVTYRDQYIFREEVGMIYFAEVCVTITHEMAHMWNGNLVTMKWWNDLWLNESFADWCSYFC